MKQAFKKKKHRMETQKNLPCQKNDHVEISIEDIGNGGEGIGFLKSSDPQIDVICVDPPRKGCDEVCIRTMLEIAPGRIVYVSCDPATLARDLKKLAAGGYSLEYVQPVDQFGHSVHVEI